MLEHEIQNIKRVEQTDFVVLADLRVPGQQPTVQNLVQGKPVLDGMLAWPNSMTAVLKSASGKTPHSEPKREKDKTFSH